MCPLRCCGRGLYGACMEKEGGETCKLLSPTLKPSNKLIALGAWEFSSTACLHSSNLVIVLRGVPDAMPKTLDDAIDKVRKFASQPGVANELMKGKGGGVQHLFFSAPIPKKALCKQFSLGKCKYGEKCKFSHTNVPAKPLVNL